MTQYSVAEARNNLPKLIDRMLAGEEVVITRRGKPVARLAPEEHPDGGIVIDPDWLDRNRIVPAKRGNAAATIAELRDEQPR